MTDAFFLPDGDSWRATSHTRGPWSPVHQHGGPPAALIAHVVEATAPEMFIARLTVDFLRPIPIDRLRVQIEPLRSGAKVQRIIGQLLHADRAVAHAVITLIRRETVPVQIVSEAEPLPPPEMSRPFQFPFFREPDGYHTAMETRLARGVSAVLDHRLQSAVNPDLTVALSRPLEGEWVGLDSVSVYEPSGIGLADTRICD